MSWLHNADTRYLQFAAGREQRSCRPNVNTGGDNFTGLNTSNTPHGLKKLQHIFFNSEEKAENKLCPDWRNVFSEGEEEKQPQMIKYTHMFLSQPQ